MQTYKDIKSKIYYYFGFLIFIWGVTDYFLYSGGIQLWSIFGVEGNIYENVIRGPANIITLIGTLIITFFPSIFLILNGLFLISASGISLTLNNSKFLQENLKTLVFAIWIAILIRSLLIQPHFIPSGSMYPGLEIGDRIFTSKYDYGYSRHSFPLSIGPHSKNRLFFNEPKRGDVVIFKPPGQKVDYIKRLIGMPGDTIQLRNNILYINNIEVKKKKLREEKLRSNNFIVYEEVLPNGVTYEIYNKDHESEYPENHLLFLAANTKEFKVPVNHYFFLGDNRDQSNDSRFDVGTVPSDRIVGQAKIIFFATEGGSKFWQIWKWPFDIQFNRLFKLIN